MKFNPEITKIKLNPEQAVLWCQCYTARASGYGTLRSRATFRNICSSASRATGNVCSRTAGGATT